MRGSVDVRSLQNDELNPEEKVRRPEKMWNPSDSRNRSSQTRMRACVQRHRMGSCSQVHPMEVVLPSITRC